MDTTRIPDSTTCAPHWIDIVDSLGQCPRWRLGPFADAREARRIERGVRRLINVARFAVVVTESQAGQGVPPASGEVGVGASVAGLACGFATLAGQAPPSLKQRQPQPSHFSSDTASHSAQASIRAR